MPRSTPSRISTRQSRRHSTISTEAGPSSQSGCRKALEPLRSPNGIPLPGILADPALKNLNKSEAQKVVNQRIRDAVISITDGPPKIRLPRMCWKNHPMGKFQPIVGHTNYAEIGLYYAMCTFGTACTYQTHGERLPEEFLVMHDVLTPLLLKREELRSVPKSESAKVKDRSRISITSSPLYQAAVKKFYAEFTRKVEPLTPPPTHPSRPSTFPCPSPICASPTSSAPLSLQPEEPFHLTRSSKAQLRPPPVVGPSTSAPTTSKGKSIDLSEDLHDVLLWAIVWVANSSKYQTALLSPKTNEEGKFSVRIGYKGKYGNVRPCP